jgi:predicted transcriptional regulator
MDIQALTSAEAECLTEIMRVKKEKKYSPTHYELADTLNKSRWRITDILHSLIDKGYVTREKGKARSEIVQRDVEGNKIRPF